MNRKILLSSFVILSALASAGGLSSASAADAIQDRYCLQGRQSGYPGNCEFSTYQQCLATASGTVDGVCGINPMRAQDRRTFRHD